MSRRPKKEAPIMLAREVRLHLGLALAGGDFALARRCLDTLERIMAGNNSAIADAAAIVEKKGVAMADDWTKMIRPCFGLMDRKFGGHPNERERANEMLHAALEAGATLEAIEAEAKAFLTAEGCTAEHVEEQMQHVRDLRSYFP